MKLVGKRNFRQKLSAILIPAILMGSLAWPVAVKAAEPIDLLSGGATITTVSEGSSPAPFSSLTLETKGKVSGKDFVLACKFSIDNALVNWMDSQSPGMGNFGFSYKIVGASTETLDLSNLDANPRDIIVNNEKIGTLTLTVEDSGIRVSGVFLTNDIKDDGYSDIGGELVLEIETGKGDVSGKDPTLSAAGGVVTCTILSDDEEYEAANPYRLEKTAVAESLTKMDGIIYEIHTYADVTVSGAAVLNEKTITDTLPAGFDITGWKVQYKANVADSNYTDLANYTESSTPALASIVNGNTVTYVVPDVAQLSGPIKDIKVTVTGQLTPDEAAEFLKGNTLPQKKYEKKFENAAAISGSDFTGRDGITNDTAIVTVKNEGGSMLDKDGVVSPDRTTVTWTATVNSNQASTANTRAVVIDQIDASAQTYHGTVTVKEVGAGNLATVTPGTREVTTTAALDELKTRLNDNVAPSATASLYDVLNNANTSRILDEFGTGMTVIKFNEGSKDKQILVMPISSGDTPTTVTYAEKPAIELVYQTKLKNTDININAESNTITNDIKIVWDQYWIGSGSPYIEVASADFSVSKTKTLNYQLVSKDNTAYTKETQQLEWRFEVNRKSQDVQKCVITDTFVNDTLALKKDAATGKLLDKNGTVLDSLVVNVYTSGTTNHKRPINVPFSPNPVDDSYAENAYWITTTTDGNGVTTDTLHVYLAKKEAANPNNILDADEYARFFVYAKVVDAPALSVKDNIIKIRNIAEAVTTVGGTEYRTQPAGTADITNTKITKTATQNHNTTAHADNTCGTQCYNATEHTVSWSVNINPSCLHIKNAVVTDTIISPTANGTSLYGVDAMTRKNAAGKTQTATLDATAKTATFAADSANGFDSGIVVKWAVAGPVFTFGDADTTITDSYTIRYTTKLGEPFRKEYLTSKTAGEIKNQAQLNGRIINPLIPETAPKASAAITDAKADANHKFTILPVTKSGKEIYKGIYNKNGTDYGADRVSWVEWKVDVNPDALELKGYTVSDTLNPVYTMVQPSFKIVANGADVTVQIPVSMSEKGFSFVIPAAFSTTKLTVTFDTLITLATSGTAPLKNNVDLSRNAGNRYSTGETSPADAR